MSYEKQTWQTGDIVTSAKLNHMEDGIAESCGSGPLIVNFHNDSMEIEGAELEAIIGDKTFNEVFNAFASGQNVIGKLIYDDNINLYSVTSINKNTVPGIETTEYRMNIYFVSSSGVDTEIETIFTDFIVTGSDTSVFNQNIYHIFFD